MRLTPPEPVAKCNGFFACVAIGKLSTATAFHKIQCAWTVCRRRQKKTENLSSSESELGYIFLKSSLQNHPWVGCGFMRYRSGAAGFGLLAVVVRAVLYGHMVANGVEDDGIDRSKWRKKPAKRSVARSSVDRGSPEVQVQYATTYLKQGDFDKAIRYCERALANDPDFTAAHVALAETRIAMGEHEQAVSQLEIACELEPNHPDVVRLKVDALAASGQLEEAANGYRRLLKLTPESRDAQYRLAKTTERLMEYGESIKLYKNIVSADPNFEDARRRLAWLLATAPEAKLRDGVQAHKLIKEEFSKSKNWKSDYKLSLILGAVLAENHDFRGASASLARAIDIEPKRRKGLLRMKRMFESNYPFRLKSAATNPVEVDSSDEKSTGLETAGANLNEADSVKADTGEVSSDNV